ncbi:MAG: hypothetical protein K2X77_23395 [Candidatus Obscuribacterales bacterium]|nr:hypothetical protein [Candidatus Obscuribacterales bacterium]
MRITKPRRPGEMITVDLLKPSTLTPEGWLAPIGFEITEPPTVYARVPHGRYAVRVMTTADAELMIHIDGAKVIETTVAKGIHIFDKDADGRPFQYGENPVDTSEAPEMVQQTLFDSGAPAECVKTHGQVAVHVRFADVPTTGPRPGVTPDYPQPVFFQMNPPGVHEETMAGLLRKVKRPAKLTAADDVLGEYTDVDGKYPERICCNCPDHDHKH